MCLFSSYIVRGGRESYAAELFEIVSSLYKTYLQLKILSRWFILVCEGYIDCLSALEKDNGIISTEYNEWNWCAVTECTAPSILRSIYSAALFKNAVFSWISFMVTIVFFVLLINANGNGNFEYCDLAKEF